MPWVKPCAVAVTIEQCRAWAGCGARLKAAIAPTAIAATNNLLMALSSLSLSLSLTVSQVLVGLTPLTADVPGTPHQAPAGLAAGHSSHAPTVDHVHARAARFADLRDHSVRLMKRSECYCMR